MKINISKKHTLGIDLGHFTIKAIEVEQIPSGWRVVRTMSCPTPPDCIKEGVVVDPPTVGQALKQMLKDAHCALATAQLAAAGGAVFVRPVTFPKMSEATLRKSIKVEASRYVPGSVEDSFVEFAIMNTASDEQMNVLVVAAPKEIVESRVAACEAAGLEVEAVDVEAFAMYRALLETSPEGVGQATTAIIDIGASTTTVSVIHQGLFAMNRSLPFGGNTLTEALKSFFKLSDEDAEQGKSQLDAMDLLTVDGPRENPPLRVIQPHLDDLVREVRRSLNYFQSQQGGDAAHRKVEAIVLAGGGAKLKGLDSYLSHKLGMPVTLSGFFDNPLVLFESKESERGLEFSVAGGLAMRTGLKAA